MPKRKLSELDGPARSSGSQNRKISMQATRLTHKFEQGVQLIARALKTARGFERQKLSRREKTAKAQEGGSTTLSRLAEEVAALKELDYHVTAERYLFKRLSKTKRIAESSAFNEFKELKIIPTEGPRNTAEANVLARLFKSNPVKNVLPDIMAGIRKLLGLEDMPSGKNNKPEAAKDASRKEKPMGQMQSQQQEVVGLQTESEAEDKATRKDGKSQPLRTDGEHDSSREEGSVMADGDGFESEDFAQLDALIAPGSDSENSEADSEAEGVTPRNKAPATDDISVSVSRSPSPSFSVADSPPPKKVKGDKASKTSAQNTTFLPSLMMGGYWSGSESEASDDEATSGPPQRKNRMGQQARRALWEKKYGAKANHIQKEQEKQKQSRDSGWDTKRGATDGGDRGRGGKHGGRGGFGASAGRPQSSRRGGHFGPNSVSGGPNRGGRVTKGASQDTGPLHPSWEAKRRAKEQATTASFQGKKVVFD